MSFSKRLFSQLALLTALLVPQASALETYFLEDKQSMSGMGAWWIQGFTLYNTETFILRFAATYKADAAVITESQLAKFKNNNSFTGYGVFDDSYGNTTVTLGPGTYYLAMRNQVSGSNYLSIELDMYPTESGYTASFSGPHGAEKVGKNGGKLWHGFSWTAGSGNELYVDGVNSGVTYWVIPASDLNAFKNGGQFSYYYTSSMTNEPGLTWLNLPTGNYYLAFQNNDSVTQTVTYQMWEMIPTGSGGGLGGPAPEPTPDPTEPDIEAEELLDEGLEQAMANFLYYQESDISRAIYLYYEGYGNAYYEYWMLLGDANRALYHLYEGLAQAVLWAYNDVSGYYGNMAVAQYNYYADVNLATAYYYSYSNLAAAWYYGYMRYYEWTGNPSYQQQALDSYVYYMTLANQLL